MEHGFWHSRWKGGQIGFHRTDVNPILSQYFAHISLQRPPSAEAPKALVPLCGKSLDVTWLEEQGCEVVGVEFVEQAVEEYFESRQLTARSSLGGQHPVYESGGIRLVVGDFFTVDPEEHGPVDLIYDRAALVAIAPERRQQYMARLAQWLRPDGHLLLVSFVHDMGSGPPFSIPETEGLLATHFDFELLEEQELLDSEPRFRARGATSFRQRTFLARLRKSDASLSD